MKGKSKITLGDILNLLGRGSMEVTLNDDDDTLTGDASSKLWACLEDRIVFGISPDQGALEVFLTKEADNEPEKDS